MSGIKNFYNRVYIGDDMNEYPEGVQKIFTAFRNFEAIDNVEVGLQKIDSVDLDSLRLPGVFGVLPHLALRRSGGGRPKETLVTFKFELGKNGHGWIALEFLAWWVRDMCRSGYDIQLRPLAFPPVANNEIQLGNSLSFLLEIFVVEPNDELGEMPRYVDECADSLKLAIEIYKDAIEKAYPNKSLWLSARRWLTVLTSSN